MADRKMVAAEMVALKAKVKAEMQRRQYNGSLTAYAAAVYDYGVTPAAGATPRIEHFDKILTPLRAANPTGLPSVVPAPRLATEADMVALEAKTALLQSKAIVGGTSDCASLCSGMCVNACQNTCTSCSGCSSCTGSCAGSCVGCGTCADVGQD